MRRRLLFIPVLLLLAVPVVAQQDLLTVDSIFTYRTRSLGPVRWTADGSGYLALEPSAEIKGADDFVRYDAATGQRSVFIPAARLSPDDGAKPLSVEDFAFTADAQRVLIFTNSQRV